MEHSLTDEEVALSAELLERGRLAVRPCQLLFPTDDLAECVAVWKAPFTLDGVPSGMRHWISMNGASVGITGVVHVFSGVGKGAHCIHEPDSLLGSLGGTALRGQASESFPHIDADWDAIAPNNYQSWLNGLRTQGCSSDEIAARAQAVTRPYGDFYNSHDPMQTTPNAYAVAGGWGYWIYENEWEKYPNAIPVLFTLKDAEPWLSVRITTQGTLVAKAIIT